MNFFIVKYKCSTEDLEQHMDFIICLYLYKIWANADTVGLNSVLRLNLHLSLCMGAEMALPNRHICTGSTKPFRVTLL